MATNFPTSLDTLTNPTSSDSLNSPSHSAQHANVNDAVAAKEAAKQSAINKLAALGLTVDEISAAFGLGDN